MWYINKFGNITGPYSAEQIRKLIRNNQLTKLHKLSENRQTWVRVDQSAFWAPVRRAPDELEVPASPPVASVSAPAVTPDPASPQPEPATPQPLGVSPRPAVPQPTAARAHTKTIVCLAAGGVAGTLALIALVAGLVLWLTSADGRKGAADATTAAVEPVKEETPVKTVTFDQIKNKIALIKCGGGSGTGFLVTMDGRKYLMSNEHVLKGSDRPEARLIDGTRLRLGAFSIATDRDLARFEIDYAGDCFELKDILPDNGDEIWVYGNSSGDGVITSLPGKVEGVGDVFIRVSAEFVPGNSGSPIISADGEVLGVATYLKNGSSGKDWTRKDTQFDKVRRFGVRFTNVRWVSVDRAKYEQECARFAAAEIFYDFLVPYLICMDATDEQYAKLKLEHKDIDRRSFDRDDFGFHEMLMAVSNSYSGQGKSWRNWRKLIKDREAFIKALDKRVDSREYDLDTARRALKEYDQEKDIDRKWETVKVRHREFIAKKKEALIMLRAFLKDNTWQDPLMRKGDEYSTEETVDWYCEAVQFWLDKNAQNLKDLNKSLKTLEGEGDED